MNSLLIQETRIRKESQIYDDLSNFIQIFKKVINLLEQTAINIQKGNEYLHLLEKIRSNTDEIEPILSKYNNDTQPLAIQRMQTNFKTVPSIDLSAASQKPSQSSKSNTNPQPTSTPSTASLLAQKRSKA